MDAPLSPAQKRPLPTGKQQSAVDKGATEQSKLIESMPDDLKAGFQDVAAMMMAVAQMQAGGQGPQVNSGGNLLLANMLQQMQANGSGGISGGNGAAGGVPKTQTYMNPGEITPEVIGLPIPSKPWPPKGFDYDKASPEEREKYMSPLEQNTYKMQLKNVRDWFKKDANPKSYEKTWRFTDKKRFLDAVAKSKAGIFSFLAEMYIAFMDTKTRAYDAFYMIYYKDRVLKPMYAPHKVAGDMWKKIEASKKAAQEQDGQRAGQGFQLAGLLGQGFGDGIDQQHLGMFMGMMQGMAQDNAFGNFLANHMHGQFKAPQLAPNPGMLMGPVIAQNLSPVMQQGTHGLSQPLSAMYTPYNPGFAQSMGQFANGIQSHMPTLPQVKQTSSTSKDSSTGDDSSSKKAPTVLDLQKQIADIQLQQIGIGMQLEDNNKKLKKMKKRINKVEKRQRSMGGGGR